MKQFDLQFLEAIFHGSDVVRRFTFKTMKTRGNCVHLAVLNRQLAHGFSVLRDKYAQFLKEDCFECLSSRKIAA